MFNTIQSNQFSFTQPLNQRGPAPTPGRQQLGQEMDQGQGQQALELMNFLQRLREMQGPGLGAGGQADGQNGGQVPPPPGMGGLGDGPMGQQDQLGGAQHRRPPHPPGPGGFGGPGQLGQGGQHRRPPHPPGPGGFGGPGQIGQGGGQHRPLPHPGFAGSGQGGQLPPHPPQLLG